MSWNSDPALAVEAGPDPGLAGGPTGGLERLLERQDQPDRATKPERCEDHRRLVLGVLLAAEAAPGIRGVHPHLGEGHLHQAGDQLLEPVRVLDRAPDREAVAIGRRDERVRLDGEVGHHREGVAALYDDVRSSRLGVDVAPAHAMLGEHVAAGEPVAGAQGGVLDERRIRRERPGDREHRRQLLVLHAHEPGGRLGQLARVGHDQRDGIAMVLRLADRQDGPVLVLGPEAGHGLRQVVRRHHEVDAGQGERPGGVDAQDPRPRAVQRHQLRVEGVRDREVREVPLRSRDAVDAADAVGGVADPRAGHRSAPSAVVLMASKICS